MPRFTLKLLAAIVVAICSVQCVLAKEKTFKVVIDAGHGAHDAGALGVITNEKSINLAVASRLSQLISDGMKDAEVVMTRSDDTFVPLQGRADIANAAKADVFISIHANSIDKKAKNRTTINGASVYTLGLDRSSTNLAVAMRENEVMKLEKDYSTTYAGFDPSSTESYIMFDIIQHSSLNSAISLASEVQKELVSTAGRKNNGVKQAPFWVLVRTSMPAILVELDFICNPDMERFMASESGQKKLARAIYNGLRNYRNLTSGSRIKDTLPADDDEKESAEEQNTESEKTSPETTDYRIQFMTSPKKLTPDSKALKGVKDAEYYLDGGTYKYTVGHFSSPADASAELKRIKKSFPDAFVVKMKGDSRIR